LAVLNFDQEERIAAALDYQYEVLQDYGRNLRGVWSRAWLHLMERRETFPAPSRMAVDDPGELLLVLCTPAFGFVLVSILSDLILR
jgi:hypothetical protein